MTDNSIFESSKGPQEKQINKLEDHIIKNFIFNHMNLYQRMTFLFFKAML